MSETQELEVYVVPVVGAVVTLQHAREAAQALADVRDLEQQLREAKVILTQALVEASKREGTKTLDLGDLRAEVKGGIEIVWDVQALEDGLRSLGATDDLISEIVKTEITYKVDARRAARAALANPEYAAVVASARTEVEKAPYVSLRMNRAGGRA